MIYYAGIGSRQTPQEILDQFVGIGFLLGKKDFVLRSGGAKGADCAFENGCFFSQGKMEIYLPWEKFNLKDSPLFRISQDAYDLAEKFHPAWNNCSDAAKKLHARNGYQILGIHLRNPSNFVVCWSPGKGGTEQALRIARHYEIPIFNFYEENAKEKFKEHIRSLLL